MTAIKGDLLNPRLFAARYIVRNDYLKHFFYYNSKEDRNIFFSFEIDDEQRNLFNKQVKNDVNMFINFSGVMNDITRYRENVKKDDNDVIKERFIKEIDLQVELFTYCPMTQLNKESGNLPKISDNINTRMDYLNYVCYFFKKCFAVADCNVFSGANEQSLLSVRYNINKFRYQDVIELSEEDNVENLYLDKIEVVKYK